MFDLNSFPCNYNSIPIGSVVNSKICEETGKRQKYKKTQDWTETKYIPLGLTSMRKSLYSQPPFTKTSSVPFFSMSERIVKSIRQITDEIFYTLLVKM